MGDLGDLRLPRLMLTVTHSNYLAPFFALAVSRERGNFPIRGVFRQLGIRIRRDEMYSNGVSLRLRV